MYDIFKRCWNSQIIIDALAVRDTATKASTAVNIEGLLEKGLYINNGLNQSASIQVQGCYTNSSVDADWVNIGTAQSVTAGTKGLIGANEVAQLKNYFPWIRVTVTCSTGPTSGSITIILMAAA